ncbi:hypothetical protein CQW23_17051 [Capsicum baccatum]|uniref:Pentatricopeptide repeat-containing protein n=1 Tax=Capsicum baccatum TaxID=33114 RepID=A0A2G2WCN7_CAPBA|nr:hypothetical protein CQW23_17051 [Capsicum baccatum]
MKLSQKVLAKGIEEKGIDSDEGFTGKEITSEAFHILLEIKLLKGISSVIRIFHTSQVASLLLRKRNLQLLGTWTLILSEYAKNERFYDVVDVFEVMPKKNIVSHNVMLSLYLGIGDFMSARQVFDEIGERNVACWKAVINGGYQKIGENITKGIPDIPEAIDCYREVKHGMYGCLGAVMQGSNKWPSYPPSFKQAMEEYIDRCTCALLYRLHLSRKIMRRIALALGGSTDEMEGEICGDPFWVLRIIGYPAASISNGHDRTQNDVGWAMTLVNQDDDIVALQVSSVLDHEDLIYREVPGWSEYLVDFGGLLVNFTSDGGCRTVLEACSFPSRVSDTGASFRFHTRTSSNLNDNLPVNSILEIVDVSCIWSEIYLETYIGHLEPNFDTAIEPLDVCLQKTGGIKKYEGAVYGKHLKIFKKPKKKFAYTFEHNVL